MRKWVSVSAFAFDVFVYSGVAAGCPSISHHKEFLGMEYMGHKMDFFFDAVF